MEWLTKVNFEFDSKFSPVSLEKRRSDSSFPLGEVWDNTSASILSTRYPLVSGNALQHTLTIIGGQVVPDTRTNIVARTLRKLVEKSQGVFQVRPLFFVGSFQSGAFLTVTPLSLSDLRDRLRPPSSQLRQSEGICRAPCCHATRPPFLLGVRVSSVGPRSDRLPLTLPLPQPSAIASDILRLAHNTRN